MTRPCSFAAFVPWSSAIARLCALCLVLAAGIVCGARAEPVRVMALGDSLTAGNPLPAYISYRKALRDRLRTAGITIDYVGRLAEARPPADPLGDLAHEGHEGYTTTELEREAPWKLYWPDIILLMAGTNDFLKAKLGSSISRLRGVARADGIDSLVETIELDYQRQGRSVRILVSSIPPIGYPRANAALYPMPQELYNILQGLLASSARPVDRTAFADAYADLMLTLGLAPDLDRIFAIADADGSVGLSDAEVVVALKRLGQYILNRYIGDYNLNVAALAAGYRNVDFVDAGAVLKLEDYRDADPVHPATQEPYDRMADPWFRALVTVLSGSEHYWVGPSGLWSDPLRWSAVPAGPPEPGQPHTGGAFLLGEYAAGDEVVRDTGADPANLSRLEVDGMRFDVQQGFDALGIAVGAAGTGQVLHTPLLPAAVSATHVVLGRDGAGLYELGEAPGTLDSHALQIGYRGSGTFTQLGGRNAVQRQLVLGAAGGTGPNSTYTLIDGDLSANVEFVSVRGGGVFNQYGGRNVLGGEPTPGDDAGTLYIAAGFRLRVTDPVAFDAYYTIRDGLLAAERIVNRGTFRYLGGTVRARVYNDGAMHVNGDRMLEGDLTQSRYGNLSLDDVLGPAATVLRVTGRVSIEGLVLVDPQHIGTPAEGATFDVLIAAQGVDGRLLGHVVLPLLPGRLVLRATIAGSALRVSVDSARCGDLDAVLRSIGQRGVNVPGDVNHDGIVDVRDVAAIAKKLPPGTVCNH